MKSLQNLSYKTLFTILFFALAGIVFFLKIGSKTTKVSAAWWDEAWHYRKSISVSNTGSNQSNVYLTLSINTSDTTRFQTDCGDIRFTDQTGNILNYYIVSGCGTASTSVHINFPTLITGSSLFYLYYGNSYANNGFSTTDFSTAATSSTPTANSEEISPGPIAYWKFDEGVGATAYDSAGSNNGIFGTGSSAPTWANDSQCISGKCLSFDGTNDFITSSSYPNFSSALTYNLWIKRASKTGIQGLIAMNGTLLQIDEARIDWYPNVYTSAISQDTTLNVGEWYMVTVTQSGTNYNIYKNSILIKTGVGTTINYSNLEKNIGSYLPGARPFGGFIDEIKIYPYARTAAQIKNDYNSRGSINSSSVNLGSNTQNIGGTITSTKYCIPGDTTYCATPIAEYNFEENTGTVANDTSGNNYNGTFGTGSSAPSWAVGQNNKGSGLSFNGSTTYVNYGNPSNLRLDNTDFTISAWIKPTITTSTRTVFYEYGASNGGAASQSIFFAAGSNGNGNLTLDFYGGGCDSGLTITPNVWNFIAVTYNKTTKLTTYFKDKQTSSCTATVGPNFTSFNGATTGSRYGIGSPAFAADFSGQIDEVKIYNYARTSAQVAYDYNQHNPIAYWKFNEGTGTTAYDSAGSNNGIFGTGSSAPTWVNESQCISGKCLSFNGSTNIVDTGSTFASLASAFTISTWVNPASTQMAYNDIFGNHGGGGTTGIVCQQNNTTANQYTCSYGNGSVWITTGYFNLTANIWQYLSFVKNSAGAVVYVNGIPVANATSTTSVSPSTYSFKIGQGYVYINDRFFNGKIDEFKIYNTALTIDEIKQDYNQGSAISFGTTTQTIGATTTSLNYCVPGDTSYCATPVAEYNFEENTGTVAKDTSGNGYTGTFGTGSSAPTWSVGQNDKGSALNFDGTDDYVNAGNISSATNSLSVSLWIYPREYKYAEIFRKTYSSSYSWAYKWRISSDNLYFALQDTSGTYHHLYFNPKPNLNEWTHLEVTFDGTNGKAYKNGALISSFSSSFTIRYNTDSAYIGGAGSECFNGKIDQIKVYDYARTPAQVAYDYNRGAPVAWYKFDECQGSTVYNSSGIGSTGVIVIGSSGSQNSIGTCQIGTSAAWTNGASGKLNSSINFDGTDDYIDTSNQSLQNNSPFSYSVWIKLSTSQLARTIIGRHNDATGGSFLGIDDSSANKIKFGLNSYTTQRVNSTMTLNDGLWHHIIGTWDGTNLKLYIDGILNASSTPTTTLTYPAINTQIGKWTGGSSQYFNGQIDDVRIYSYALTNEQIKQVYNGGAVSFQ